MENERRNNHNILLTVIAAATLIVAMIGATFAYFSATSTADKQNITTGELKISANSTITNNENIKPTKWTGESMTDLTDENKTDIAEVTLTVNTGGTTIEGATYNIYLTTGDLTLNTTDRDSDGNQLQGGSLSDIKWELFDTANDNQIGTGDFTTGKADNLIVNTVDPIDITANDSEDHIYKLYIWIQDDDTPQNQLQNLSIDATLKVEAKQSVITD